MINRKSSLCTFIFQYHCNVSFTFIVLKKIQQKIIQVVRSGSPGKAIEPWLRPVNQVWTIVHVKQVQDSVSVVQVYRIHVHHLGLWNHPPQEGLDSFPLCSWWQCEVADSGCDSCCPLAWCRYIGVYPSKREGSLPPPSDGGTDSDLEGPLI